MTDTPAPRQQFPAKTVMVIGGLLLVGSLLTMAVLRVKAAAELATQGNNTKQIGLAFNSYAGSYNDHLPEVMRRTADGKEALSWRLELMPFIEGTDILRYARLDEAWDSDANLRVLVPVSYYRLPSDKRDAIHTPVRVFAGGAIWDEAGKPRFALEKVPAGWANTGMVFLSADRVPWTRAAEPRYAADAPAPRLLYPYLDTTLVGMADGSVRTVKRGVSEEVLRGLVTGTGAAE